MINKWENKKVLITGANGFLASWIVKNLLQLKADVWALNYEKVSFSIYGEDNFEKYTHVINGDIRDNISVMKLIREHKFELIIHVGAQAINKTALESPYETLETNIKGTYNILEAVRTASPSTKVIVASSDKAYGTHLNLPYVESYPLHGEYPYEVSKSCADLISLAYFRSYNLPICIVRCSNIYGGGDWHFSRVVPATIVRILNSQPPILISNTKRDYIYAEDAARGYIKLAEAMFDGLKGEAFNFGNGVPVETDELLKLILSLMNKDGLGIQKSTETRLEIPSQYLSIEKAKDLLGFSPTTSLSDGLKKTIEWYTNHINDLLESKLID